MVMTKFYKIIIITIYNKKIQIVFFNFIGFRTWPFTGSFVTFLSHITYTYCLTYLAFLSGCCSVVMEMDYLLSCDLIWNYSQVITLY